MSELSLYRIWRQGSSLAKKMITYNEFMEKLTPIPSNYTPKTFEMFYKYIPTLPAGDFVDFGTGLGKSVVGISLLNPKLNITTIDWGKPYIGVLKDLDSATDYKILMNETFADFNCENISFHLANNLEFPWNKPLVGLNIDSSHTYDDTLAEINKWVPFVKIGGLVFFDDYGIWTGGPVREVQDHETGNELGVVKAVNETMRRNPQFMNLEGNSVCQVYRRVK